MSINSLLTNTPILNALENRFKYDGSTPIISGDYTETATLEIGVAVLVVSSPAISILTTNNSFALNYCGTYSWANNQSSTATISMSYSVDGGTPVTITGVGGYETSYVGVGDIGAPVFSQLSANAFVSGVPAGNVVFSVFILATGFVTTALNNGLTIVGSV